MLDCGLSFDYKQPRYQPVSNFGFSCISTRFVCMCMCVCVCVSKDKQGESITLEAPTASHCVHSETNLETNNRIIRVHSKQLGSKTSMARITQALIIDLHITGSLLHSCKPSVNIHCTRETMHNLETKLRQRYQMKMAKIHEESLHQANPILKGKQTVFPKKYQSQSTKLIPLNPAPASILNTF